MGEEPRDIKTLDCPQSEEILPKEEIPHPETREIENPFAESFPCNENVGGSSKIEDAQIERFLDESIQECEERGEIQDAQFAEALRKSAEKEIEDTHEETLEKSPLDDDALLFETLEKPQPDEIDDALMESLLDSIGADEVQDDPSLDTAKPQLGSIADLSSRSGEPSFMDRNPNFTANDGEGSPFFSQRWNEPGICPVGAGLANLGNTCFLNAILQCFTHTVPLVQGLLSLKHEASSHGEGEFCVLCAVRCQIELSLAHSGRVISPSNLVDNLSQISSFFQRYQQEDAHEFLQCLLDKLDDNWSKYEVNTRESSLSNGSLVKQLFGGRLVSQVRCCKCGHNSNTYEPLIDLSLEIENADSIESALKSFTKVESIEDTEKFICEGCKKQVPVEKQLMLDQAPSVATLHLKRFKSDGIYVEKIDKKVEYPLELDLKPYSTSADGNEELRYELLAVVVHVGLSSISGHYFCYIRTAPDTWYRFDDSKVSRVPEATALSQDAYILFYTRKGTEWFSDFFEKWEAVSGQMSRSTSPKSVLDDMDLPSTSSNLDSVLHGCEEARKRDTPEGASEPISWLMPDTNHAVGNGHCPPTNRTSVMSSNGHFCEEVKIDKPDVDAQFSSLKRNDGEACSPSRLEKNIDIDPCTPPRSQSPDIYSDEEPAEAKYLIPLDHLKVVDKNAAVKKSMDKAKNDVKRKEAARYMSKSMPSGRRQSLMAAMMGTQSDSSMNKKRRKQGVPLLHEGQSPKKRSKISPKHVLRPVAA